MAEWLEIKRLDRGFIVTNLMGRTWYFGESKAEAIRMGKLVALLAMQAINPDPAQDVELEP